MIDERLIAYANDLVAREDVVLTTIRARAEQLDLPPIHVSPEEGKLLQVLVQVIAAERVLEVGTLAGYSTVWIARGLRPGGRVTTIERDTRHADLAERALEDAGLSDRVTVMRGDARDVMRDLRGPFDAIFLDADKEPLPSYLSRSMELLRLGGLLLCDNTFFHGRVIDAADTAADVAGVRRYNETAAGDRRLASVIVPVRDGLMLSLKVRD